MKISKHVHSCLLVEENGKTLLIDPGNYTFEEKALDVAALKSLDYILITHEHQDHVFLPFLKAILEKFPQAKIISNPSVAEILREENILLEAELLTNEDIILFPAPHELLLGGKTVENYAFDIFEKLTHPGDSLKIEKSCEILALPIQAPWGSAVAAIEKAAKLRPKIVIPIHDWHWKDEARKKMYEMAKNYLSGFGIELRGLETGEVMEI
ncbi:MBL fold metallo-hydrolase [Candidatus Giovannonibacteria bacterium]|nr:MBL fold metallo-hydrolase [Candidatus Giovannonibacteria bacterium]